MLASIRNIGGGIVLATLLGATPALAQRVGQKMVVEPPVEAVGEVRTAGRDQPLLTQMVRSDRHVEILTPVSTVYDHMLGANRVNIPSGTILHSASRDGDFFCAPLQAIYSACLEDTDADGRFDVVYEASIATSSWTYMAFSGDGEITMAVYSSARRLPPTPYRDVGPDKALRAPVKVFISSNYSSRDPSRVVKATLSLYVGKTRHRSLTAHTNTVAVAQRNSVPVSILDATLELQGFEPDGAVRYKVIAPIPSNPEQFSISPF